jgi:hypothetical protein
MIRVVHLGSPDPDFLPIPDPGSRGKKAPDLGSGSATLVDTTEQKSRHISFFIVVDPIQIRKVKNLKIGKI